MHPLKSISSSSTFVLHWSTMKRIDDIVQRQKNSADFPSFCIAHVTDPNYRFLYLDDTCIRSSSLTGNSSINKDVVQVSAERAYYEKSLLSAGSATEHSSSSPPLDLVLERKKENKKSGLSCSVQDLEGSSRRAIPAAASSSTASTAIPPPVLFHPAYIWKCLQWSPYSSAVHHHHAGSLVPFASLAAASVVGIKPNESLSAALLGAPLISLEYIDRIWEQLARAFVPLSATPPSFSSWNLSVCWNRYRASYDDIPSCGALTSIVGPHAPHVFKHYEGLQYFVEDVLVAIQEESPERIQGVIQFMFARLPMTECFLFVLHQLSKPILYRVEQLLRYGDRPNGTAVKRPRGEHPTREAKKRHKEGKEEQVTSPPLPTSLTHIRITEGSEREEDEYSVKMIEKEKRSMDTDEMNDGNNVSRSRKDKKEEVEEEEEYTVDSDSEDSRPFPSHPSSSAFLPSSQSPRSASVHPSLAPLLSSISFSSSALEMIQRSVGYMGTIFYMMAHLLLLHRERDGILNIDEEDFTQEGEVGDKKLLSQECTMAVAEDLTTEQRISMEAIDSHEDMAKHSMNRMQNNTMNWTGGAYYGKAFEHYLVLVSRRMVRTLRSCVNDGSGETSGDKNSIFCVSSSIAGLATYSMLTSSSTYKYLLSMMKTWVSEACWSKEAVKEWHSLTKAMS